jgi:fructosamine-3-kinase
MIPLIISNYLQNFHKSEISDMQIIGGGSINYCYKYTANSRSFFIKYNNLNQFPDIIKNEVEGLKAIADTQSIATPEIILFDQVDSFEFLILPFIEQGRATHQVWETFGEQLAVLHQNHNEFYGWNRDNYIGSLKQSNKNHSDFITFFREERLQKQINLASSSRLLSSADIQAFETLFSHLPNIIPDNKPSLVHGDLWSGNFMVSNDGIPYLIDPSIQYNFRETDIAFTYLFGGFDQRFYESYQAHFPLAPGFNERVKIYNLYPLLVHLNLFGNSYLHSIQSTLKFYS